MKEKAAEALTAKLADTSALDAAQKIKNTRESELENITKFFEEIKTTGKFDANTNPVKNAIDSMATTLEGLANDKSTKALREKVSSVKGALTELRDAFYTAGKEKAGDPAFMEKMKELAGEAQELFAKLASGDINSATKFGEQYTAFVNKFIEATGKSYGLDSEDHISNIKKFVSYIRSARQDQKTIENERVQLTNEKNNILGIDIPKLQEIVAGITKIIDDFNEKIRSNKETKLTGIKSSEISGFIKQLEALEKWLGKDIRTEQFVNHIKTLKEILAIQEEAKGNPKWRGLEISQNYLQRFKPQEIVKGSEEMAKMADDAERQATASQENLNAVTEGAAKMADAQKQAGDDAERQLNANLENAKLTETSADTMAQAQGKAADDAERKARADEAGLAASLESIQRIEAAIDRFIEAAELMGSVVQNVQQIFSNAGIVMQTGIQASEESLKNMVPVANEVANAAVREAEAEKKAAGETTKRSRRKKISQEEPVQNTKKELGLQKEKEKVIQDAAAQEHAASEITVGDINKKTDARKKELDVIKEAQNEGNKANNGANKTLGIDLFLGTLKHAKGAINDFNKSLSKALNGGELKNSELARQAQDSMQRKEKSYPNVPRSDEWIAYKNTLQQILAIQEEASKNKNWRDSDIVKQYLPSTDIKPIKDATNATRELVETTNEIGNLDQKSAELSGQTDAYQKNTEAVKQNYIAESELEKIKKKLIDENNAQSQDSKDLQQIDAVIKARQESQKSINDFFEDVKAKGSGKNFSSNKFFQTFTRELNESVKAMDGVGRSFKELEKNKLDSFLAGNRSNIISALGNIQIAFSRIDKEKLDDPKLAEAITYVQEILSKLSAGDFKNAEEFNAAYKKFVDEFTAVAGENILNTDEHKKKMTSLYDYLAELQQFRSKILDQQGINGTLTGKGNRANIEEEIVGISPEKIQEIYNRVRDVITRFNEDVLTARERGSLDGGIAKEVSSLIEEMESMQQRLKGGIVSEQWSQDYEQLKQIRRIQNEITDSVKQRNSGLLMAYTDSFIEPQKTREAANEMKNLTTNIREKANAEKQSYVTQEGLVKLEQEQIALQKDYQDLQYRRKMNRVDTFFERSKDSKYSAFGSDRFTSQLERIENPKRIQGFNEYSNEMITAIQAIDDISYRIKELHSEKSPELNQAIRELDDAIRRVITGEIQSVDELLAKYNIFVEEYAKVAGSGKGIKGFASNLYKTRDKEFADQLDSDAQRNKLKEFYNYISDLRKTRDEYFAEKEKWTKGEKGKDTKQNEKFFEIDPDYIQNVYKNAQSIIRNFNAQIVNKPKIGELKATPHKDRAKLKEQM